MRRQRSPYGEARPQKDYAKQKDCETELFIDGNLVPEADLGRLGIVLSQPPLRAPVLAQHTLNYLFTAKPSDRTSYFKALLEVTDLDEFRAQVAALESTLASADAPLLGKLAKAAAIPSVSLEFLLVDPTDQAALQVAFEAGSAAMLQGESLPVPPTLTARADELEKLLAEKRSKTFPLNLLSRVPFTPPAAPDGGLWTKLERYVSEKAKIEEEVRWLTALFRAALAIPEISEAESDLDCPLCGTQAALTPGRIAFIRGSVASTESFQTAERDALTALNDLQSRADSISIAAAAAVPRFAKQPPGARRKAGFAVARMRWLLADTADAVLPPWLRSLVALYRTKHLLTVRSTAVKELLKAYIAMPADLVDMEPIKKAFVSLRSAMEAFNAAQQAHGASAEPLQEALRAVLDGQSDSAGWQDFIDLSHNLPGLCAAAVDSKVREQARAEIQRALKQIDKGIEKVLDNKFEALSGSIEDWWNRLRSNEPTFFSAVRRRGRNTIDFKGGLSPHGDQTNPKIRDVIAVFSDSQLHCLGLAVFLARAERYGMSFVVLDDPF